MKLTIAIITKNRPENLKTCLAVVCELASDNFSVLIIDNHPKQPAKPVYLDFKSLYKITIEYICEPLPGYSRARNCALDNCKSQYIGFIDDDCIPDKYWVQEGLKAIIKFKSAYVSGVSRELDPDKLFIRAERHIYKNWCLDFYNKETYEIRPKRLDTKNIILDIKILNAYNIRFDERFNKYGGEDTDLGFQLKKAGQKGYFAKDMVLFHASKNTFKNFKRRSFSYGFNCYNLFHKWHPHNECVDWDYCKNFRFFNGFNFIDDFKKIDESSLIKKIQIYCLIKIFNYFYLKGYYARKRLTAL